MQYELELKNITKRFGNNVANHNVNFQVKQGEVHALVGENGAGKTTLMNIIYGLYQPDEGEILSRGKRLDIQSPHDAIAAGIGMVHQHFMLAPDMTIAENIGVGNPPNHKFVWREQDLEEKIKEIQKGFELSVPLSTKVSELSVGQMQRVEIIKTLYRGAKVIILDEPTAMLTPQETKELFDTIRELVKNGHTVIFITHRLKEVMEISDRVTVLRAGSIVGTVNTKDVTSADIARMMIGREMAGLEREEDKAGEVALSVQNLTVLNDSKQGAVNHISFHVRQGEILGIAGVEGNGQTELTEALIGVRAVNEGKIELFNKDISNLSVKKRKDLGIAYIPQDRMQEGVALEMNVMENIIFSQHEHAPLSNKGIISWEQAKKLSKKLIQKFAVKTSSPMERVGNLSGGNIQKVIVARELSKNPEVVIACQPTRGVDIGSAEYIHQQLINVRDAGGAVLMVSADLDEIFALSDRILVMYDGKKSGEMKGSEANEEILGSYMFGTRDGGGDDGKSKV